MISIAGMTKSKSGLFEIWFTSTATMGGWSTSVSHCEFVCSTSEELEAKLREVPDDFYVTVRGPAAYIERHLKAADLKRAKAVAAYDADPANFSPF